MIILRCCLLAFPFSLIFSEGEWRLPVGAPEGASLALGRGTKPVLDIADFMDRSALACLSSGYCLSPLCTDQEYCRWVCLSVKSDRLTETGILNRFFWIHVERATGLRLCMCVFASSCIAFSLCWVWSDGLPITRPEPAGEITMTKTLLLQVFF